MLGEVLALEVVGIAADEEGLVLGPEVQGLAELPAPDLRPMEDHARRGVEGPRPRGGRQPGVEVPARDERPLVHLVEVVELPARRLAEGRGVGLAVEPGEELLRRDRAAGLNLLEDVARRGGPIGAGADGEELDDRPGEGGGLVLGDVG